MQQIIGNIILCISLMYFEQSNIFETIKPARSEVEIITKIRCLSDVAEISYIVQSAGPDRLTAASINDRTVSSSNLSEINRKLVTEKIDKISMQGCPDDDQDRNSIKLYLELKESAGKRLFILLLNRNGTLIVK